MSPKIGKITGTFLDEITWDIGSLNWSADDWKHSFEAMKFIGIDTVIIIRGGLRDRAVFPSEVVGNTGDPDLAQLFLDEAAKHGMRLIFGTYDSALWQSVSGELLPEEVTKNIHFIDEVLSRYGGHPALGGWYITQEVCSTRIWRWTGSPPSTCRCSGWTGSPPPPEPAAHTAGVVIGRFAPSPSGPLHVGNLRTAIVAWLAARSAGGRFLVRVEDLDAERSSPEHERSQLSDLARIGIDWDEPPVRQSERLARYADMTEALILEGATYECFCTRREIAEATLAPNEGGAERPYPGTCRDLGPAERARRRLTRPPAIRLRADGVAVAWPDWVMGPMAGTSDDVVIQRNDGASAYNLAVVVDDHDSSVSQVVRGDDIAPSTPRQVAIARWLGYPMPEYAHVPLVRGPDGSRLAKRHGAVTLDELGAAGHAIDEVVAAIVRSIGLELPGGRAARLRELAKGFDLASIAAASPTIDLGDG